MSDLKKGLSIATLLFVGLEILLFFLIQLSSGVAERAFCFASVVLAFLFSSLALLAKKGSELISVGLLFTVFADFCLVVIEPQERLFAMYFFIVVQLCYFGVIFNREESGRVKKIHSNLRFFASIAAAAVTYAVLQSGTDLLSLISTVYYVNLLLNVVFSFIRFRSSPFLAIGLLLFSLCDAVVGLSLIDIYLPVSENSFIYKITHTDINLIWAFYVPSQTLISLSTVFEEKRKIS